MIKKQLILVLTFGLTAALPVWADRRPPETMCRDGVCGGTSLEIPVHFISSGGDVLSSTPIYHDRGHNMSAAIGEPFSGDMHCAPGDPDCTEDIQLTMGYEVMEFYSDRLPLYNVSLTVNGGSPVTNQITFTLGIQFKDDLSGFASSTVTQRSNGHEEVLNIDADNFFEWKLGEPAIADGKYTFDFVFQDRAGNVTVPAATATVTLDRVPPIFGSVLINKGNVITSTPTVNLDLQAMDDRTGISFVRISNSSETAGTVYSFVSPKMAIDWALDDSTGGPKAVYVWYRDGAGNWSVNPCSDTITLDQFNPKGSMTFVADGENVIENTPGEFQTKVINVPVQFDWDASVTGVLKSIQLSGGPLTATFEAPQTGTRYVQSYTIAPEDAEDGYITLTAIFRDIDGKPSAPSTKTILLNRFSPPNPTLVNLQIFSSSLTFTCQVKNTERNLIRYTITPDPSSLLAGASSETISIAYSSQPVTFTDTDLHPNTPYFYTVRAFDALSGSVPGLRIDDKGPIFTHAEPPLVDAAPLGVEINVIRVSWKEGNNPVGTEYQVEYSKDETFPKAATQATPWSFRSPVDVEGLDVGSIYYFRVAARNSEKVPTDWVNLGSGQTLSYIQPQAPLSFTGEEVTYNSVKWKWIRNPSTESGFKILNATQGVVADIPITVSTDSYAFVESGLTPNTVASRSIFAYNYLNDVFTPSSSIGTTIILPPAPPEKQALGARGSEITAHWGTNGNPTGTEYQAEIALNETFTDQLEASGWLTDLQFVFRGLQPQTTYYVRVQSRGQMFQAAQLTSQFVFLGAKPTQTFSAEREVNLEEAVWQLHLPANALDQDFAVQMEMDEAHFQTADAGVIQRANEKAYRESNGYRFPIPEGLVEITLTDLTGHPISPVLKKPGTLSHIFQTSANNSPRNIAAPGEVGLELPDPLQPSNNRNILAKTLRIWVLDTKTETWFRLPSNDVDVFLSRVGGGVQRFGVFAVMGAPSTDVNDVMAFPIPWRPNGPNAGSGANQTGTEADGITFGNIPQEGTIRIVDLSGSLIKQIDLSGNALEPWDVKNTDGEKVSSGTYYWIAESGGNKKTGKVMVIR